MPSLRRQPSELPDSKSYAPPGLRSLVLAALVNYKCHPPFVDVETEARLGSVTCPIPWRAGAAGHEVPGSVLGHQAWEAGDVSLLSVRPLGPRFLQ